VTPNYKYLGLIAHYRITCYMLHRCNETARDDLLVTRRLLKSKIGGLVKLMRGRGESIPPYLNNSARPNGVLKAL
jgi:hypothetical protein